MAKTAWFKVWRFWVTTSVKINWTAMRSVLTAVCLGLMTVSVPVTAYAGIVWTLSGVTFGSGGNVIGTFTTDGAGNLLYWDITTSAGGGDPGAIYDSTTSSDFGSDLTNVDVIQANAPITNFNYLLYLSFSNPLVTANTPDQIVYAAEFPFFDGTPGQTREGFVGQAIAAETVPEPGSLGPLGLSIFFLSIEPLT
jgi:hypothetical protein